MATKKKRKAKASTPKKRRAGTAFGAKAEFIRSLPPDMPAKQVVEEGAKKGLKFSANYVYGLRTRAAKKGKPGPSRARGPRRVAPSKSGDLAAKLRATIAELGLTRAREVLAEIDAAFGVR